MGEKAYFGSISQPCNIWPQSDNLKKTPLHCELVSEEGLTPKTHINYQLDTIYTLTLLYIDASLI